MASNEEIVNKKNQIIISKLREEWADRRGPRVGDFIEMKDGSLRRFTHEWSDGIQVTNYETKGDGRAFFMYRDGEASYSGGLDSAVPKKSIEDTGVKREANFWFFSENIPGAGRGITFKAMCRVYREV